MVDPAPLEQITALKSAVAVNADLGKGVLIASADVDVAALVKQEIAMDVDAEWFGTRGVKNDVAVAVDGCADITAEGALVVIGAGRAIYK